LNNLPAFIKAICWQIVMPETLATGSVWSGLRLVAAEGCPYIGPTGTPGLWITSDHGHLGWTLAAGSVRLLADLMVGTKTEIASEPQSVTR
jgi:D-amino-acid dehydrogenase